MNKIIDLPMYLAGEAVNTNQKMRVHYPYDKSLVGTISMGTREHLETAITRMLKKGKILNRYQRYEVLNNARELLKKRADEFATYIRMETGLCDYETRYELGRTTDFLMFSSMEALRDDGQIFSCDISAQGKNRKIFTLREPLDLMAAITPFNHPLNQVAHKVAPAIAAGTPVILKPSDKTPITAIKFCELLYEAGLPGWMLSVMLGPIESVIEPMVRDERICLVSFTGSVAIGKHIANIAGYKKTCLELGGNAALIVLLDADLDLAASLAAEGSYRNSGQRCTAVKRILVHEKIEKDFVKLFIEKTKEYKIGDPADPKTKVGTVIDEASAIDLENRVKEAVAQGATVVYGGKRNGAQMEPTIITNVPRTARMVCTESFGPLSPVLVYKDIEDAIHLTNDSFCGLSCGVVTNDLQGAIEIIKRIKTGTVNVNAVPGYRIENSPFGGVKDSGLGIKEGVIEAMKTMSTVKTFSLPW
ncbi:MAG: aldehyde dehydrogenase family protein [Bacteriovoracaceae bacterium]